MIGAVGAGSSGTPSSDRQTASLSKLEGLPRELLCKVAASLDGNSLVAVRRTSVTLWRAVSDPALNYLLFIEKAISAVQQIVRYQAKFNLLGKIAVLQGQVDISAGRRTIEEGQAMADQLLARPLGRQIRAKMLGQLIEWLSDFDLAGAKQEIQELGKLVKQGSPNGESNRALRAIWQRLPLQITFRHLEQAREPLLLKLDSIEDKADRATALLKKATAFHSRGSQEVELLLQQASNLGRMIADPVKQETFLKEIASFSSSLLAEKAHSIVVKDPLTAVRLASSILQPWDAVQSLFAIAEAIIDVPTIETEHKLAVVEKALYAARKMREPAIVTDFLARGAALLGKLGESKQAEGLLDRVVWHLKSFHCKYSCCPLWKAPEVLAGISCEKLMDYARIPPMDTNGSTMLLEFARIKAEWSCEEAKFLLGQAIAYSKRSNTIEEHVRVIIQASQILKDFDPGDALAKLEEGKAFVLQYSNAGDNRDASQVGFLTLRAALRLLTSIAEAESELDSNCALATYREVVACLKENEEADPDRESVAKLIAGLGAAQLKEARELAAGLRGKEAQAVALQQLARIQMGWGVESAFQVFLNRESGEGLPLAEEMVAANDLHASVALAHDIENQTSQAERTLEAGILLAAIDDRQAEKVLAAALAAAISVEVVDDRINLLLGLARVQASRKRLGEVEVLEAAYASLTESEVAWGWLVPLNEAIREFNKGRVESDSAAAGAVAAKIRAPYERAVEFLAMAKELQASYSALM